MTDDTNSKLPSQSNIPVYAAAPNVKPQYAFTNRDTAFSAAMLLMGFAFMRYVFFNVAGYFTTAFFVLLMTLCVVYLKGEGKKLSFYHLTLCGVYYAFSLVFSITDNGFVKSLDTLFLLLLGAYTVFAVANDRERPNRHFTLDMLNSLFSVPFAGFGCAPKAMKTGKKSVGRTILLVLLGLLITVPLTLLVFGLLSSADEGFNSLMTGIFKDFTFDIALVLQIILAIPVGFYLFGLLFSNIKKFKSIYLTDEWYDIRRNGMRILPSVTAYAAVTPIVILYLVFVFVQADYFFSAFSGALPASFSYAEYARQGFFELFAIALINLAVIAALTLFSKYREDGKKPLALKVYTIVLSALTLLILATAFSKMALYIESFGLTRKRVYVSWFMILIAIFFVVIIIKQIKEKLCIANAMSVVFTLLFAVLCFGNIDGQIARYNIYRYTEYGEKVDLEALYDLSDDGWAVVLKSEGFSGLDVEITKESKENLDLYYGNYENDNLGESNRLERLSKARQFDIDYKFNYYNLSSLAVKTLTEKMN